MRINFLLGQGSRSAAPPEKLKLSAKLCANRWKLVLSSRKKLSKILECSTQIDDNRDKSLICIVSLEVLEAFCCHRRPKCVDSFSHEIENTRKRQRSLCEIETRPSHVCNSKDLLKIPPHKSLSIDVKHFVNSCSHAKHTRGVDDTAKMLSAICRLCTF